MNKRIALALAAVCLVGSAAPARINPWTMPHVLTISDGGFVNTLNPHLEQSAPVANLSELTMAWLLGALTRGARADAFPTRALAGRAA